MGNAMTLLLAISISLTIAGSIILDPLLKLFGASEFVPPYARDHPRFILWGAALALVWAEAPRPGGGVYQSLRAFSQRF